MQVIWRVWSIIGIVRVYFWRTAVNYGCSMFHWRFFPLVMDTWWCHSQGFSCCKLVTGDHNWRHVSLTWMNVLQKKKINDPTSMMSWYGPLLIYLLFSKKVLIAHFESFTFSSKPFTPPHTSPANPPTKHHYNAFGKFTSTSTSVTSLTQYFTVFITTSVKSV